MSITDIVETLKGGVSKIISPEKVAAVRETYFLVVYSPTEGVFKARLFSIGDHTTLYGDEQDVSTHRAMIQPFGPTPNEQHTVQIYQTDGIWCADDKIRMTEIRNITTIFWHTGSEPAALRLSTNSRTNTVAVGLRDWSVTALRNGAVPGEPRGLSLEFTP